MEKQDNIILTKTIAFSLLIIEFCEELEIQIKEIGLIIYKILSSSKKK